MITAPLGILRCGLLVLNNTQRPWHVSSIDNELLREALSRINSGGREFVRERVDFGYVIGENICVETTDEDTIAFGRRGPGADSISRFAFDRRAEDCESLFVILRRRGPNYILVAAGIGDVPEPEPGDHNLQRSGDARRVEASLQFWANRARVVHPDWPVACWLCNRRAERPIPLHQGIVCEPCMHRMRSAHGDAIPFKLTKFAWGVLTMPTR